MNERFDRGLFATVLLALAMLISLSSAARFPAALRFVNPLAGPHGQSAGAFVSIR
jgi:hypothetical protein